jgi:hypothetical protein
MKEEIHMRRTSRITRSLGLLVLVLPFSAGADTKPGPWISLFDGKTLGGWKSSEFAAGGEARVEPNFRGKGPAIVLEYGDTLSGITWKGGDSEGRRGKTEGERRQNIDIPRTNYEIMLEFMKTEGNDFACGLTFPVGDSYASLILGGWGGATVGISSIDGKDASQNETTRYETFKKDRWYKVRLRVTPEKIESWLDEKKVVDVKIVGRKINLRSAEINKSTPLGIATYRASAAYRDIKLKLLAAK